MFRRPSLEDDVLNVLIVEDNIMIADQLEDSLLSNGYGVCGIASDVSCALALYQLHNPDLIILDLRLAHGDLGTTVAARLPPSDKVGILYVTGSGGEIALSNEDGHACLSKPYVIADLLRSLRVVFDLVETGAATPPFPSGFHLLNPTLSTDLSIA